MKITELMADLELYHQLYGDVEVMDLDNFLPAAHTSPQVDHITKDGKHFWNNTMPPQFKGKTVIVL